MKEARSERRTGKHVTLMKDYQRWAQVLLFNPAIEIVRGTADYGVTSVRTKRTNIVIT